MLSNFSRAKKFLIFIFIGISLYLIILKASHVSRHTDVKYYEFIDIEASGKINKFLKIIKNPPCGRFPMLTDLNVSDINWQVTNTTNGTFYLFNAYFDDREALKNQSIVRILALINKIDVSLKAYCQFWFDGINEPISVEVKSYLLTWNIQWSNNTVGVNPFLINCPNPLANLSLVPQFVSFVEQECGHANNVLEIRNKRPKNGHKEKFLVSVKCLDFQNDISLQLIEWMEFLKIFGVNKVEIFIVSAHPNVIRVLKMYQAEGLVTIKYFTYPHDYPYHANDNFNQFLQNDLIPYHDSFYENLHLYEYLVPMDIDEFIVPLHPQDRTWTDMLVKAIQQSKAIKKTFHSYPAHNMYFLLKSVHKNETISGIPKNLRFLSNIYRAANYTPYQGGSKSFMRTDLVEVVHNHFPQKCLGTNQCEWFIIPHELGHNAHYRTECTNLECTESLVNPINDTRLWKFKDEILRNLNLTIGKLKEFRSDLGGGNLELSLN